MALSLDAGFPKIAQQVASSGSPITTAAFSTPGTNRTLLAVVLGSSGVAAIFPVTVSGAGLSWSEVGRSVFSSGSFVNQQGVSLWMATAAAVLTSQTVSVARQNAASEAGMILAVYSFAGAKSTIGASGSRNDPTGGTSQPINAIVNALAPGSIVIGGFINGNANSTLVANGSTTFDSTLNDSTNGSADAAGHSTSLTAGPGNVTVGATISDTFASTFAVEIQAAGGTLFSVGLSETVALSESVAEIAKFNPALSESPVSSEAVSISAKFRPALSEGPSLSESLQAAAKFRPALSESPALSEALASRARFAGSLSESPSLGESIAAGRRFMIGLSESIGGRGGPRVYDVLALESVPWSESLQAVFSGSSAGPSALGPLSVSLLDLQNVNSYRPVKKWEFSPGDAPVLYFRLEIEGVPYFPAPGAVLVAEIVDEVPRFRRFCSPLPGDQSAWALPLMASDPVRPGVPTDVSFTLKEGIVSRVAKVRGALLKDSRLLFD